MPTREKTVRYTDDSRLMAFTDVRFQQLENECRWIELSWYEQLIAKFANTFTLNSDKSLKLYRELVSLVTDLQTSTPIIVENRN
jgi:hypothetical protein